MNDRYSWNLSAGVTQPYCTFSDIFSEDEINDIIKIGESEVTERGQAGSFVNSDRSLDIIDINRRDSYISWISSSNSYNFWLFRKITDVINAANKQFFNFNLEKIESLQYTIYKQGCFYNKHADMKDYHPGHAVRKLSFSLQLIDEKEYDAGDLVLCLSSNQHMPRKKGTLIIFPSYLIHEVTKVTRGTRKSLVGWVEGPPFK